MRKIVTLLLTFCFFLANSQERDYKGTLIQFHKDLLNGKLTTYQGWEKYSHEAFRIDEENSPGFIRRYSGYLTDVLGRDHELFRQKVIESKVYDHGTKSQVALDIQLSSGTISFGLNRYEDEPIYIDVFVDGLTLYSYSNPDKPKGEVFRNAIIVDPDGYTNIRESSSAKSDIVAQIKENEVFYYSLHRTDNWVKVTTFDRKTSGYMHISRIAPVSELEPKLRKQVEDCRWNNVENCRLSN